MIFQTEKQIKEYGDKIPSDKKGRIENALGQLREAHKNKDITAIDRALAEINAAWQAASEDIYKQTQEAPARRPVLKQARRQAPEEQPAARTETSR